MVSESENRIENLSGPLYDLDITGSGKWISVTEFGEDQSLSFNGKPVLLHQQCRYPHIRAIDEETCLLVDGRTGWREENAWIITASGEVKAHFYAGDAVEDVLTSTTCIVITYFDESACTSPGIEGNGVAVFDLEGNFKFGYSSLFGGEAVDVADCYAACWAEDNRLLFFPYTDFPLVLFDLENRNQRVWQTPVVVAGSGAITSLDNKVWFHSAYRDESGIYEWRIGDKEANRIGSYSGELKGLSRGRFLAVGKNGYTVISLSEI